MRSVRMDSRVTSEPWMSLLIGMGGTSCLVMVSMLSARLALRLRLFDRRFRRSDLSTLECES